MQREQIIQIFADDARSIGVEITTTPLDFSLLVDQLLSTGDDRPWDAILIGLFRGSRDWPSGSNVDICSGNLHMFNTTGDCLTPQETLVEELHKLGRATLDTDRARDIMFEIQAIQSDQAQILYTVSPMANYSWPTATRPTAAIPARLAAAPPTTPLSGDLSCSPSSRDASCTLFPPSSGPR